MDWKERYRILSPLSESFKGALFLAENNQTHQKVVCRVLYHTTAEHYRILQSISSPNIPHIFEMIQEQEDTIIVEEYIPGETLEQYLKRGGTFSPSDTVGILLQLCRALEVIHSYGVIHRDIKPANILLSNGRVVLVDFDAARQYQYSQQKDTVYMGTEGYAAPEQYGFAQTDSRSDIYSLGVVLKELCGEDPHYPLAPIIQRCTAFDPSNRYTSVQQIMADLEHMGLIVPKNRPIPQPPVPIPPPVRSNFFSRLTSNKKLLKFLLYTLFGLEALFLLTPQAHEVTTMDYILSKLVYLPFAIFPAVILLNFFHIWNWLPFVNSSNRNRQIVGIILCIVLFVIVIMILNSLAYAFYSPEALEILKNNAANS